MNEITKAGARFCEDAALDNFLAELLRNLINTKLQVKINSFSPQMLFVTEP